ncbi:SGNH/GDSL hydrolase family protein [Microbacterium sp. LMI1x-1-1.1]|uniref:SGNH/GDSL hydrolase family protein n=1 Tax=Microbacterium sp. LMI1x-1-1.1 TaxID=3135246 RepID=UPI00342A45B4
MKDSTGRRLDAIEVPARTELSGDAAYRSTSMPTDVPPPVLDINYAERMALHGFETHTRAATDTYTDALGATQTAVADVPVFDRGARSASQILVPLGLKLSPGAIVSFNPNALLPATADYTIVVDVDRASGYANNGAILTLDDGAGGTQHRVVISLNSNYQPSFTVQASGAVVVNQAMGNIQSWGAGRPRRLVLAVKSGAYFYSDTGLKDGASTTGGSPSKASLTRLTLGSAGFAGWIRRVQIIPKALTRAQVVTLAAAPVPLACWGDSMTEAGWPNGLREMRWPFSGTFNGGVGGETSTQIRTRMLADTSRTSWTTVIWAGRNNYADVSTVLADIAAMVANLSHRRFLVLSVTNKSDGTESTGSLALQRILALNEAIRDAYPEHYLDIRSLTVAASGGAGDAPAPAWTSDGLHPATVWNTFISSTVGAELRYRGWF